MPAAVTCVCALLAALLLAPAAGAQDYAVESVITSSYEGFGDPAPVPGETYLRVGSGGVWDFARDGDPLFAASTTPSGHGLLVKRIGTVDHLILKSGDAPPGLPAEADHVAQHVQPAGGVQAAA